jgi:hypothetical protein
MATLSLLGKKSNQFLFSVSECTQMPHNGSKELAVVCALMEYLHPYGILAPLRHSRIE